MGALAPLQSPVQSPRTLVEIDRIEVVDRLRAVDLDWAAALAVSIEREGLIHPVELRRLPGGRLRLVVGAHRLEAHRILGRDRIEAEVLDVDTLAARAREIAENVMRRELSPLDRAAFVAELYEVEKGRAGWEGQSQQAYAASKRWAKDAGAKIAGASGLRDEVAVKVGLSARTVANDLALYRDINPDARALILTHPVAENASQLRLLARSGDQLRIARMLANGDVGDVRQALDKLQPKARASKEDKAFSAFVGSWSRMGARERRRALAWLASQQLPKGCAVTNGAGQ